MKKFVAMLLALSMTALLGACAGEEATTDEAPAEETIEAPVEEAPAEEAPPAE